jgi:hypothetical protein
MRDREAVGIPCDRKAVDVRGGCKAVDSQNTGALHPEDV